MNDISTRVATRFIKASFQVDDDPDLVFTLLADAAQEAEYMHAEDGTTHVVTEIDGGEVVYTSKGGPE